MLQQPVDVSICNTGNVSFTSTATSTEAATVQWTRSTNGVNWVAITPVLDGGVYSNFTSTTLNITGATTALNGYRYQAIFTNTTASVVSDIVILNVAPSTVAGTVNADQTVCIGNIAPNLVLNGSTGSVLKWQKSADASFTAPVDINNITATLTGISQGGVYASAYFRAVVQSGICPSANATPALITMDAAITNTTPLAGVTGGAAVTAAYDVAISNNYLNNCAAIARVVPSGASAVNGTISATVTIDGTVQTASSGEAYVQRHYNIDPSVNASTATSTITLYFLQSEFNAFNAANGSFADLPANGTDAAGIANLRITQYNGTGTTPGTYPPGSGKLINPADADIVWNNTAGRWEVTFAVTGSGGFYVHTGQFVLPVTGVELKGEQQGTANRLTWITTTEINNKGFELQRSADGKNFSAITFVTTKAENGNSISVLNYSYNDAKPLAGNNYYRLKQTDKDGKFTYSNIVTLGRKITEIMLSSVYPNPTDRELNLVISSPQSEKITIVITDVTGKVVTQVQAQLIMGSNQQRLNVQSLAAGTYLIKAVCSNGCETAVYKFIKK